MAHCRLNKTTGNGAPPILIVWADEGEPGFDCLFLSPSKARAIIELVGAISSMVYLLTLIGIADATIGVLFIERNRLYKRFLASH